MFKGSIWIIGGSPLKNDVWRGSNLTRVYPTQREKSYVGEFCEKINDKYQAAAPRTAVGSALVVLVVVGLDFFLLWR